MSDESYVHGYSPTESERLCDQAGTLAGLLHHDTRYADGRRVLEAGCGVGAQTVVVARGNPGAEFTSVDVSADSLERAEALVMEHGLGNVRLLEADVFALPFELESFDDVFVCFLLEHLAEPLEALIRLRRVLRPGGTMTVIEGDHGSAFFHPDSAYARAAIRCLVDLQSAAGGDALIGRRLYPLMCEARLKEVRVSPRFVYADASRPRMAEGFTRRTFTAMVAGVREQAVAAGLATAEDFDRGIQDLERTAEPEGVFCYTFFKGLASN